MKEDMTREFSQTAPEGQEVPKMDRRSFLLALSGGALALTATGLLAGCGGGGTNGNSFSGGGSSSTSANVQQYNGSVPFGNGQTGAVALIVSPDGTANGTITVSGATVSAKPRVTSIIIPNGTYAITGTVDPVTGAFNLSTTVPGTGPVTIVGTLPTSSTAGTVTTTVNGQVLPTTPIKIGTFTGSSSSSSSSSTTSSSSSSSSSSSTGTTTGAITSNTVTNARGGYTTTLLQNGSAIAVLDTDAGYPASTLTALAPSALPSAATLPSGNTLLSPYIYKLVLNTATTGSTLYGATLTVTYSGGSTNVIAFTTTGTAQFGAFTNNPPANGHVGINVGEFGGILSIAYGSLGIISGLTGYVGIFTQ